MHRIVTSIRQIDPAEIAGLSDQQLLDRGMHPLGQDHYSCVHQEEMDADGNWRPKEGQQLPGTIVTEGTLEERHKRLPGHLKAKIMKPGGVHPHSWAGEPKK
jgi:hypothetical protein